MSGTLDGEIAEWRARVSRGGAVQAADADELENHLRDQVAELMATGLAEDEAFLVAVKRLGKIDQITAEYAREHSGRLWKQLVLEHGEGADDRRLSPMRAAVFAAAAAVLIQVARLASGVPESTATWFLRDLGFFVLVPLLAYFAVSRRISLRPALALAAGIVVLAVLVNVFPFSGESDTQLLVAVHLPVLLWFLVGIAYVGGNAGSSEKRMDFLRFTGEWAIYYVLIALGGGVLLGLTGLVLEPIAPGSIDQVYSWVVPSGAAAAVIVAAWLVEAKKSVIENIAPVLTAIFTPLFAVMLLAAVALYSVAVFGQEFDRDLLLGFDALLLVVLGLVLYGLSARDPLKSARLTDSVRLVAVVAALLLDLLVLGSMLGRIGEFGLTANRTVALGLNILLIVNLAGTALVSVRVLAARVPGVQLERWQTSYLPVFAAWAAAVVLILPAVFRFA